MLLYCSSILFEWSAIENWLVLRYTICALSLPSVLLEIGQICDSTRFFVSINQDSQPVTSVKCDVETRKEGLITQRTSRRSGVRRQTECVVTTSSRSLEHTRTSSLCPVEWSKLSPHWCCNDPTKSDFGRLFCCLSCTWTYVNKNLKPKLPV